jgi:hypothetical protein
MITLLITAVLVIFFSVIDKLMIDSVVEVTIIVEFVLSIDLSTPSGKLNDHHLVLEKILDRLTHLLVQLALG